MSQTTQTQPQPTEEARREAKNHPNGWLYVIDPRLVTSGHYPTEAIIGAWKVDETGSITGEFMPNPQYAGDKNALLGQ